MNQSIIPLYTVKPCSRLSTMSAGHACATFRKSRRFGTDYVLRILCPGKTIWGKILPNVTFCLNFKQISP